MDIDDGLLPGPTGDNTAKTEEVPVLESVDATTEAHTARDFFSRRLQAVGQAARRKQAPPDKFFTELGFFKPAEEGPMGKYSILIEDDLSKTELSEQDAKWFANAYSHWGLWRSIHVLHDSHGKQYTSKDVDSTGPARA